MRLNVDDLPHEALCANLTALSHGEKPDGIIFFILLFPKRSSILSEYVPDEPWP